MFYRILPTIMNGVMLYSYVSIYLQGKNKYPVDGWIYGFYALFYDLLLVIFFFQNLKDKPLMAFWVVSFIVQNIAGNKAPSEVPEYGMYSNIVLVVLGIVFLLYKKSVN
jgi:hypothetical protein